MSSLELLKLIFSLIFTYKSWSQALSSNDLVATAKKDAVYRFLASPNSNWEKLLLAAAVKIVSKIEKATIGAMERLLCPSISSC